MLASSIRELAAARNSTLIAAARFTKTVQVWDLKSQQIVCEFAARFCMGAGNLALSPNASTLVTGISTTSGVIAAYEAPSGKVLWERKHTYPSRLRFSSTGDTILCTRNNNSVLRMETGTGATTQELRGACNYFEGQHGEALHVPKNRNKKYNLRTANGNFDIDRISYAVLDAQFAPHSVCFTEAGGPVRSYNLRDSRLQWTYDSGGDGHVLRLYYSEKLKAIYGVRYSFRGGEPRLLLRFDAESGTHEVVCTLDSWEDVFIEATDQIVTSHGAIINLADGSLAGQLEFPLMEYPDK